MASSVKKTMPENEHPHKAIGWAARDNSGVLSPFIFSRRNTGDDDVTIKILFCGICHSDLHNAKNEWHQTAYPVVPGHEIAGIVTEVGRKVSKFMIGDKVGVGCLVNSCRSCDSCKMDFENYCHTPIYTCNSVDTDGTKTYGGYSNMIVVNEHFVVRFPESMPLDKGAPLLCAGITVYSPMKYFGLDEAGKKLGVVGLGGLGHVAVKFGKAFGLKVTVISTSPSKEKEAIEHLGADSFIVSKNPEQMKAAMGKFDGIIDTVSSTHAMHPLMSLLKPFGKMVVLGLPEKPLEISVFSLVAGAKTVCGSFIGGQKDTQEMLDFAAKHKITADIELVGIDYLNTAMDRLLKADVRYRFVIDIENTLKTFSSKL